MWFFLTLSFQESILKAYRRWCSSKVGRKCSAKRVFKQRHFLHCFKHFVKHAKCSINNPVMLMMDNQSSHISFAGADFAKENWLWPVTFYLHTSHKLQPLDQTVLGPFKCFYRNALANWMREHPNAVFSIYSLVAIAKTAFDLAFTRNNILSGISSLNTPFEFWHIYEGRFCCLWSLR